MRKLFRKHGWNVIDSFYGNWHASPTTTPRFRKDRKGFVWIDGEVQGASDSTDFIFSLPVGYRPNQTVAFASSVSGPILGTIGVQPGGDFFVNAPGLKANNYVSICCSFYAGA